MAALNIVNDYVAVWNESDATERRRRIRSVWAPDGATCYRLLDAHGYEAIESRVIGSWEKWLRDGKYVFRPKRTASHHDVVKFDWVMVTVPGGEIEAAGLSFLMLNANGQIRRDYQFNPSANDAQDLAERYIAMLNEADAEARRRRVAELWAPGASLVTPSSIRCGLAEIENEAARADGAHLDQGFAFAPANGSQAHHNVARLTWQLRHRRTGQIAAAGSELLILDEAGRIHFDYRFDEPV